jgi:hypothetical protein
LFLSLNGRVSITAAEPGQVAYAGVFTIAFCKSFTKSPAELRLSASSNWSRFMSEITAEKPTIYTMQPCHKFYIGKWER